MLDSAHTYREPGLFRSALGRAWLGFDRVVRDLPRPWRWRFRLSRLSVPRVALRNLLIVGCLVVVMVGIDALGRSAGM